jgi:flagellar hook-length control protein FliK
VRQSLPGTALHARAIAVLCKRASDEISRICARIRIGPALAFVHPDYCGSIMALSSANAVSPAPAVDNTAKANASVAATGTGTGGTFTDSLDAVLAPQGAADTKTSAKNDNDAHGGHFGHGKLSKFKNKLMNGDAAIMLTPQQLQQQQAIIRKLGATNTGVDIPALRAAMGKSAHIPGGTQAMPVLDPVTGKVSTAQPAGSAPANDASAEAFGAALNAATTPDVSNSPAAAPLPNSATTQTTPATAGDASTSKAATQQKLVAALLKTAKAPVLKDGQADGSKVPNAKIAHHHTQKTTSSDDAQDAETVQSMAAKIAATTGATNSADTAHAAAKSVAVAEVASKTTPVTPTVTKIETAAMANATQTATHTPTPQAKIEAQALPVQFDAASASPKDKDSDSKSGNGDKSQTQAGSARIANSAPSQSDAPAPNFPDAQPATPAPAHTNSASANANLSAAANTQVAAPTVQPQIAATLHVSQQPQQDAPTADQTTFAALGVAIAAKSKDGEKQFDINMHPADLGKIDVRISVNSDGQAQAHLTAEHPQTLQLLKQDQQTLAQNLRDAGLDVSNSGLSFSLKGEQQPSTPTFNARSRALSISAVQTADVSSISSQASLAPGDSRLDIRV